MERKTRLRSESAAGTHEAVAQLVAHGVGLRAGGQRQRGLRARLHLQQRVRRPRQPRLQRRLLRRGLVACGHPDVSVLAHSTPNRSATVGEH